MGRAGQVQNASHLAESLNFAAFQPPSLLLIRGRHALHPSCGDAAAREPPPNSIDLLHTAYLKGASARGSCPRQVQHDSFYERGKASRLWDLATCNSAGSIHHFAETEKNNPMSHRIIDT